MTADGLLEKDKKDKKPKEENFFKQVARGGLKLLSYDSSSLHKHEARVIKKSFSANNAACLIIALAILILIICIVAVALPKVGTIK